MKRRMHTYAKVFDSAHYLEALKRLENYLGHLMFSIPSNPPWAEELSRFDFEDRTNQEEHKIVERDEQQTQD